MQLRQFARPESEYKDLDFLRYLTIQTKDKPKEWPAVVKEMMAFFRKLDPSWFYSSGPQNIVSEYDFLELRLMVDSKTGKVVDRLEISHFREINIAALIERDYKQQPNIICHSRNGHCDHSVVSVDEKDAQHKVEKLAHAADDDQDTSEQ